MAIIIGLTGENCAGKGTLAEYLGRKSFYYASLSDVIREELAKEGREITRDALIAKGNELRRRHGPGAIAALVAGRLGRDRNYVIDSIRSPAEVAELAKLPGFVLIRVSAPPEVRFGRMKARAREGDPRTYDGFVALEKAEAGGADSTAQQLAATIALAAKTIVNDADFQHLYDETNRLLGEIAAEFKPHRPSWDEYFMSIAVQAAARSNCMKRHVAAVIVKDKRIVSTGYNGTPRGVTNCDEGGCPRCNGFADGGKDLADCLCSHGEENAIVQASFHGIGIRDSILYSTFSPCLMCAKMIVNAGIKEVVYNAGYPLNEPATKLFRDAGVILRQLKLKE